VRAGIFHEHRGQVRRYVDEQGGEWDVVLGRESWGALLALFVPRVAGTARQALLRASDYNAAQQELDALDDRALGELLSGSTEKSE
jgi:hypothetical protein